jgi:hypothetical protein
MKFWLTTLRSCVAFQTADLALSPLRTEASATIELPDTYINI